MFVLMLVVACCVFHLTFSGDLCNKVKIEYIIGRATRILDILAEEISQMHVSCYKEVIITGAKRVQLHVTEAEFGFNKAYEYNGLIGTGQKPVYDKIEVHLGDCSTFTPDLEVKMGLQAEFQSDVMCLYIQPEVKYRTLAAHMPGGRIRIDVSVDIAICPAVIHRNIHHEESKCQPLCSKFGRLNNCQRVTGTTITSTVSVVQLSTAQTTPSIEMSHFTTTTEKTPTTHQLLAVSAASTGVKVTGNIQYSPSPTFSTRAINTTSEKRIFLTQSGKATTSLPVTTRSLIMFTQYRYDKKKSSTSFVRTTSFHSSDSNAGHEKANFGLLEGLYVIATCIVVLSLIGIIAFFVRKRRENDSSTGSISTGVFRADLHWRDNWLVRYHNNEAEGDSFSQSESDLHYLYSNFHNQSNSDSQFLNQTENTNVVKYKIGDNPYDKPWPLVRLDSEFVRNTKKVADGRENTEMMRNLNCVQNISDNDGGCSCGNEYNNDNLATNSDNLNTVHIERGTNNENKLPHKHQFLKQCSPPLSHKGNFNVKRSNSTKNGSIKDETIDEKKPYLNHAGHKHNNSESYSTHPGCNTKRRTRQRSSSSVHSGQSSTFEEMMRGEIKVIENAMDMKDNNDINSEGYEGKRNWKVNTLYAVVSSRNRMPFNDISHSMKSLQKFQVDGINSSESCKLDFHDKSKSHLTKKSWQKKSNSSQKSCNINEQLGKSSCHLENVHTSKKDPSIHNTFINSIDCNAPCQEDIPLFEDAKENKSCLRSQPTGNKQLKRNMFLENRQKFEKDGSIMQTNNGATGTGQFLK